MRDKQRKRRPSFVILISVVLLVVPKALQAHETLCISTTYSANEVFECNISEVTLVSK